MNPCHRLERAVSYTARLTGHIHLGSRGAAPLFILLLTKTQLSAARVLSDLFKKCRISIISKPRIGTSHIFKLEKQELNLHLIQLRSCFCQLNYFPIFFIYAEITHKYRSSFETLWFLFLSTIRASRTYSKLQQPPCLRVALLFSHITTLLSSFH